MRFAISPPHPELPLWLRRGLAEEHDAVRAELRAAHEDLEALVGLKNSADPLDVQIQMLVSLGFCFDCLLLNTSSSDRTHYPSGPGESGGRQ